MHREFRYKILVVDNATARDFTIMCPETRVPIETKVFNTIDEALYDLGVPRNYFARPCPLNPAKLRHDYDIVLLDFQMNENTMELDEQTLNQLLQAKDLEEAKTIASGLIRTEYPMGALSLLPLYKETFDAQKRGTCVIQGYSSVMHRLCPKAVVVFELTCALNIHRDMADFALTQIEPNSVNGVPIGRLLDLRARSILRELPADCLGDLLSLIETDCTETRFWTQSLDRVAAWLQCDTICFRQIRPDLADFKDAQNWLRGVLAGRGYANEAERCWKNDIVYEVAHRLNLSKAVRDQPTHQVVNWVRPDGIVAAGNETYRVCPQLRDEMKCFPYNAAVRDDQRVHRMHRMFRMTLSDNVRQGYLIEDVVSGLPKDPFYGKLPPLQVTIHKAGDAWGRSYLWVHRRVLYDLLSGFLQIPRFVNGQREILCYADSKLSRLYFVVRQSCDILPTDVPQIEERARQSWGPFPLLTDWGRLEIWPNNAPLYQVTSLGLWELDKKKTVVERPEVMTRIKGAGSEVVMVLPLSVEGF